MPSIDALDPHKFYTPEEIAPLMGLAKTELRRYCRISGHCTRLSRNKIMLDQENARAIHQWIKDQQQPSREASGSDPFA